MADDAVPKKTGLALYANLLDDEPDRPKAPPAEDPRLEEARKQIEAVKNAALKFNPSALRRGPSAPKPKPKSQTVYAAKPQLNLPSSAPDTASAPATRAPALDIPQQTTAKQTAQAPQQTWKAEDWKDDEEGEYYLQELKAKRAEEAKRRKMEKKKRKQGQNGPEEIRFVDWNAIYDPEKPTNFADYTGSDEYFAVNMRWVDRVLAANREFRGLDPVGGHRAVKEADSRSDSRVRNVYDDQGDEPIRRNLQFAPPTFDDDKEASAMQQAPRQPMLSPQPTVEVHNDATGEDAYARRMRLSQQVPAAHAGAPPSLTPVDHAALASSPSAVAPAPSAPTAQSSAIISRAPVRYAQPETPADLNAQTAPEDAPEQAQSRNKNPGQKGFAARMMAKMGWEKGQGLGASGTGIVTPLSAKLDKRERRFDDDTSGPSFVGPASRGTIVGGQKSKSVTQAERDEAARLGELSEVVRLTGMLTGVERAEEESSGKFRQELGDECNASYGRVERVVVRWELGAVFIKFTSQLSAMRALQALQDQERNGSVVAARFWDVDKFETGQFEG